MARITSEVASNKIGSKYDMILIAAVRARELSRGYKSTLGEKNRPIVTAIKEIEQGIIGREYLRKVKNASKTKRK